MVVLQVSLFTLFKDDTSLSVIKSIEKRWCVDFLQTEGFLFYFLFFFIIIILLATLRMSRFRAAKEDEKGRKDRARMSRFRRLERTGNELSFGWLDEMESERKTADERVA